MFRKEVSESRHIFRALDAWGFDSEVLHKLPKGTRIEIYDTDNEITYQSTREECLAKAERYLHFKSGDDYGKQVFVAREHFSSHKPTQEEKDYQDYLKYHV